jgi:hypothetical protein
MKKYSELMEYYYFEELPTLLKMQKIKTIIKIEKDHGNYCILDYDMFCGPFNLNKHGVKKVENLFQEMINVYRNDFRRDGLVCVDDVSGFISGVPKKIGDGYYQKLCEILRDFDNWEIGFKIFTGD